MMQVELEGSGGGCGFDLPLMYDSRQRVPSDPRRSQEAKFCDLENIA